MVTPKPRELERKMSEEKKKEGQGVTTGPKPEVQTVRFELTGVPVVPGSDAAFYQPDQRRQGDLPPGVQTVPAIWMPSPQDGTWQYTVLTENNLANDLHPTSSPQGWYGPKLILTGGGIVIILLMVLRFLARFRLLSRFRPKPAPVQNTLKIVCQVPDELPAPVPKITYDPTCGKCFTYTVPSRAAESADRQKLAKLIPPYSCIFTSAKNKVPRVFVFEPREDEQVMDQLGLTKVQGLPYMNKKMDLNIPTETDLRDPRVDKAHLLLQINDTETESGCVIAMDVHVKTDSEEARILRERKGVPFSVTVEQLITKKEMEMIKANAAAKK